MREIEEIRQEIIQDKKIGSKFGYYLLYENGFLGNKPLTWNSLEEIEQSGWKERICVRGRKGIPREKSRFNLTLDEMTKYVEQLEREGIPKINLTFNQAMPDEHLIIQGEVMRDINSNPRYMHLTYSTVKEPMNRALEKETLCSDGINALFLLKGNLYPPSYDDLQELLELFPDSIIEFSAYDISVGNISNRNAIIWEVRNY